MIPTHVRKIWLMALALLALWGLLSWLTLGRLHDLQEAQDGSARNGVALVRLQDGLNALDDMEKGNRAFLRSGREQDRAPFYAGRNTLSARKKWLVAFYRGDHPAQLKFNEFKVSLDRWFALSNAAVAARRGIGDSPSRAQLRDLSEGEAQRARVLEGVRKILRQLSAGLQVRVQNSQGQQGAVQSMIQAVIGFGFFGIAGLSYLLARQSHKINESNESVRREVESRRRAERERQILASHNEQILNSTTEGIVGLNVKGRITFANPAAAGMLGWEVAELMGKSWHDMAQHSRGDNSRLDKDASPVMSTLRDASPRRISDDVFWKRTGRTFPVEYAVSPLYELSSRENEEKQLSGATLTFRDITERKRSEIALLRLASVVESSKDAILSHLLDGTIVSCNASAVKMYGYSAREMEGKALSVLLPPSRADEAMLLVEHISRGERIEPYQTTLVTRGGERVDVAITFYPVLDARGNIMGASSNARPIRRAAPGTPGSLPTFEALRVAQPANGAAGNSRQEAVGSRQ